MYVTVIGDPLGEGRGAPAGWDDETVTVCSVIGVKLDTEPKDGVGTGAGTVTVKPG